MKTQKKNERQKYHVVIATLTKLDIFMYSLLGALLAGFIFWVSYAIMQMSNK